MIKSALRIGLVLMCAGACSTSNRDESQHQTRTVQVVRSDSAGVHIIKYALGVPDGASPMAMTLDTVETFGFDSIARTSNAELHRVSTGAFLSDGRVVVGHASLNELLLLDPKSGFVRSIGKEGSGPGEFRSIAGVWVLEHDELAVFDETLRRIVVVDTVGRPIRETLLSRGLSSRETYLLWRVFNVSPNGDALLWLDRPAGKVATQTRPKMQLALSDTTGNMVALGPERPGLERFVFPSKDDRTFSFGLSPFAPSVTAIKCGNWIAVADNSKYDVTLSSSAFNQLTQVRADVQARQALDEDFVEVTRLQFGAQFDVTPDMIPPMRMMTPTGLMPVIRGLFCEDAQRIWVEETAAVAHAKRRVAAYLPDGALSRTILVPSHLRILAISGSSLLTVSIDDDGNEHVATYRLRGDPVSRNAVQ